MKFNISKTIKMLINSKISKPAILFILDVLHKAYIIKLLKCKKK